MKKKFYGTGPPDQFAFQFPLTTMNIFFTLIERLKVFNVFTNPIVVLDRRRHNDISLNEFIIFYQRQSTVRRIFVMLWC